MAKPVGAEPTLPLTAVPAPIADPVTLVFPRAPNCAAVPSVGATATTANAGAETKRNAAHPKLASKPEQFRLNLEFVLATRVVTCPDRVVEVVR